MPRTVEQNEVIRNERISKILIASLYLFANKGYDATTLDEIAKVAGCSHGLLYHYFKDKYNLYNYLINEVAFPLANEKITKVDRSQKAKFVLRDIFNVIIKEFKSADDKFCWAVNLLISVDMSVVEGTKTIRVSKEKNDRIFMWFNNVIEKGKEEGDIPEHKNTKELTAMIICIMKGMAYIRMKLGYKKFISPDVGIIMDMVL